jgi:hypothetical protein
MKRLNWVASLVVLVGATVAISVPVAAIPPSASFARGVASNTCQTLQTRLGSLLDVSLQLDPPIVSPNPRKLAGCILTGGRWFIGIDYADVRGQRTFGVSQARAQWRQGGGYPSLPGSMIYVVGSPRGLQDVAIAYADYPVQGHSAYYVSALRRGVEADVIANDLEPPSMSQSRQALLAKSIARVVASQIG